MNFPLLGWGTILLWSHSYVFGNTSRIVTDHPSLGQIPTEFPIRSFMALSYPCWAYFQSPSPQTLWHLERLGTVWNELEAWAGIPDLLYYWPYWSYPSGLPTWNPILAEFPIWFREVARISEICWSHFSSHCLICFGIIWRPPHVAVFGPHYILALYAVLP